MTPEKIGILCENYGAFDSPWNHDSAALMHRSGHNIGNFAFWNIGSKLIGGTQVKFPFGAKPENYIGKIDKIFIPAANFLNENGNLGWLAEFIETLDVPCAILGLGAQSEDTKSIPKLTDGTIRFLHAVAARTPFLGVRGEFSQSVCEHYGVKNSEVLGCPSILTNPNKQLGRTIEAKWHSKGRRVAVHAACIKGNARNVERRLFEFLDLYPGSSYIIQRPVELMKVLFGENVTGADAAYLKKAALFLAPDLSYEEFSAKLARHSYVPFSIDSWIAYLRHFSHAVGTRIHGSILSLSAEIPTVCVYHDTRTKELCDVLRVPSIPVTEVRTDRNSVSELFKYVTIDGSAFDENRIRLAARNRALLSEAGFPISKHLENFTD